MSKLVKYITFSGTMTAKSGIHVGGGNESTKVGGCDNPVIRDQITGLPYIPGSSIKGVLRSILEEKNGNNNEIGEPCGCGMRSCVVCSMFGAHKKTQPASGKPRLVCRDMKINADFAKQLIESGKTYADVVEVRTSTMINRNSGTATGGLRNMEVVAAGTVFDCRFTLQIFEGDKEEQYISTLKRLINAVELNRGIGSKVTSGNGEVEFNIDWNNPVVTNI